MSTRKSVRFQDLSLIQESEEDGAGEITLAVASLVIPSPSPQGDVEGKTVGQSEDSVKAAGCPFGERIAKERAAKQKEESKQVVKENPEEKFPRNIILLQQAEKERASKRRVTAGVNPKAGKERGKYFVTTHNYLCNLKGSTQDHLQGGLCIKTIDLSAGLQQRNPRVTAPYKGSLRITENPKKLVQFEEKQNLSIESKHKFDEALNLAGNIQATSVQQERGESTTLYRPDPELCRTVNPYIAPSNQLYGSAAYQLKPTPQDSLSKLDVVSSSRINQYLHQPRDIQSAPPERHIPSQDHYQKLPEPNLNSLTQTSSLGPCTVTSADSSNSQSLQFLRDNFSNPVPISKDKLFHSDPHFPSTTEVGTHKNIVIDSIDSGHCQDHKRVISPVPPTSVSRLKSPVGPIVSLSSITTPVVTAAPVVAASPSVPVSTTETSTMNYMGSTSEIYTTVAPLSRMQEKQELQNLNDRFSAYVGRVRQLGQQANNVDTSAFLRSTKILEDEIVNLKNMYETELEKLRKEIEAGAHERNNLNVQYNKQQKYVGEMQDRLAIETNKNAKLLDEINVLQRKISNLEAEVQDARITAQRPQEALEQMQRSVENLTREVEQWKHRYEHEQVARQEAEDKVQQIMKKLEFSDQVHNHQTGDYQNRLDTASATILSLEAKVRELSTTDVTVSEMLKQVRDTAETELKKYQIESEEQYSRNLTALKAQIDHDADALQRCSQEKSELMGSIGELQAKIRNLEGQVANLQHQKKTLEDAISVERNRGADSIRGLEKKLREVQDMLVVKMREVTNAREANIPLKAEIETLKALLEEEERRLRIPLGIVPASVVQTSVSQLPTTSQILNTSSLSALQAATSMQQQQTTSSTTTAPVASVQSLADAKKASALQEAALTYPPLTQPAVPLPASAQPTSPQVAMSTTDSGMVTANFNYSSSQPGLIASPLYPYAPSPPLNTLYIPEALRTVEEGSMAYDADYGAGLTDYDLYMQGFSLPMTGPRYLYEASPSLNRLHLHPSPPLTPRAVGPIQSRVKSAPANAERQVTYTEKKEDEETAAAEKDKNVHLISTTLGCGRDYFDEMFQDLQRDTLFPKPRPKSSPLERKMPSSFHDYTVSTSSAIGDLKILEVNQDGKFVRLVNDGPTEFEFGGFMIQQNVGGHPVAVFRFPPRTKFPPDSTITVWSAMNDPHLHSPPTDFYWKEQQKWGTGPECTTILCRANGQAVAWTTAAHRFTKDAFEEVVKPKADYDNADDLRDDESLTELNMDANGPRPEPVYLRREKQQPPSLIASKHPHGTSPAGIVHPHTSQPRPLRYGNDNSTYSRQSRTQTTRPDPIPGQPYSGAPAQRVGSAPLRKLGSNQGSQPPTIRGNGALANKSAGSIRMAPPQPFLSVLQEQLIDETRDRAHSLIRFTS